MWGWGGRSLSTEGVRGVVSEPGGWWGAWAVLLGRAELPALLCPHALCRPLCLHLEPSSLSSWPGGHSIVAPAPGLAHNLRLSLSLACLFQRPLLA